MTNPNSPNGIADAVDAFVENGENNTLDKAPRNEIDTRRGTIGSAAMAALDGKNFPFLKPLEELDSEGKGE